MRSKHLTDEQFRHLLLHLADAASRGPVIAAEAAMIELLARSGLRCEELARLKVRSLDETGHVLHVLSPAKGGLGRSIRLDPAFTKRLKDVIDRASLGPDCFIFEAVPGAVRSESALSAYNFKQRLRSYWRRLRLSLWGQSSAHLGLHCLRHTVAIRVLESTGGHVMKAKMALGHKSIHSTLHYINYLEAQSVQDDVLKAIG